MPNPNTNTRDEKRLARLVAAVAAKSAEQKQATTEQLAAAEAAHKAQLKANAAEDALRVARRQLVDFIEGRA